MNIFKKLVCGSVLSLGVSLGFSANTLMSEGGHPYFGLAFGYGSVNGLKNSITDFPANNVKSGSTIRASAGYLWTIEDMAVGAELASQWLPLLTTVASVQPAIDMLLVGQYFVAPEMNIFGKVGGSYMSANYCCVANQGVHSGLAPTIALGAGYEISKNFEATVAGHYYFGHSLDLSKLSQLQTTYKAPNTLALWTMDLGLVYKF